MKLATLLDEIKNKQDILLECLCPESSIYASDLCSLHLFPSSKYCNLPYRKMKMAPQDTLKDTWYGSITIYLLK